jgi:hypothetical protein
MSDYEDDFDEGKLMTTDFGDYLDVNQSVLRAKAESNTENSKIITKNSIDKPISSVLT